MRTRRWFGAAGAALLLGAAAGAGAQPGDRLERFREMARLYAQESWARGPEAAEAVLRQIFALVDAEVLENLSSGEPFASAAFVQERLDAFGGAWGAARFRVARFETGPRDPAPITIGLFHLWDVERGGLLRVYGRVEGRAALLAAESRDGEPDVHPWPAGRGGEPQILATWVGTASGQGSRPFHAEVWRRTAEAAVRRVWSTAELHPDGLLVSDWKIKAGELVVRYELRYPGWKPGCPGQAEAVDTYRPGGAAVTLARHQVGNGWHRELGAAAARLFAALGRGDQRALAELVPDPGLRRRLPAGLRAEPACDQQSPDAPGTVMTVALSEREGASAPWSLSWRRGPRGWRLLGATPVLQ
ncbi:MAG TPA: hypothetical protein VFN71_06150 [Methylomirabilota bacterium]|nr:hypothetical protein [Methylomirabilota bacterium]